MNVIWMMTVMKRMEYALTLMGPTSVAVKWDTDSQAMVSTAVVSFFAVCSYVDLIMNKVYTMYVIVLYKHLVNALILQ